MSKYDKLWKYLKNNGKSVKLSFDEIYNISGIEIDHSFLRYKKELEFYGFKVGKISIKNREVSFEKISY